MHPFKLLRKSYFLLLGMQICWTSLSAAPGETVLSEDSEQAGFSAVIVAEGFDFAWDIAFLPDGQLLLSENDGRLRVLSADGRPSVIPAITDTTDEGGLLGISPHPQFASNRLLYFCYAAGTPEANHTRIARARFNGKTVESPEVIFNADNSARELAHYGCRLLWLPDGTLVATMGDRRHHFAESQDLADHYGVAVRLNADGSIPRDNPFSEVADARSEIWLYGIRNTQGAAFHPVTGELWASDHGPYGGDEINVLRAGRNYGWPIATFGIDYDGSVLTDTPLRDDVEPPVFYWYPSIAPASIAFYTGNEFPKWRNDLFVASLAAKRLLRLELLDGRVIRQEDLLAGLDARIRDVTMGPDGRLYVLTDTGDSRLLRLQPK